MTMYLIMRVNVRTTTTTHQYVRQLQQTHFYEKIGTGFCFEAAWEGCDVTPIGIGGSVTAPRVCEGSVTATGTHPCVRVSCLGRSNGVEGLWQQYDGDRYSSTCETTKAFFSVRENRYGFLLDEGPRYNVGTINRSEFPAAGVVTAPRGCDGRVMATGTH